MPQVVENWARGRCSTSSSPHRWSARLVGLAGSRPATGTPPRRPVRIATSAVWAGVGRPRRLPVGWPWVC